ncbi:hypothetical protein AA0472_0058 [Acetobacter estunensis NRIC 0472]|uniref:DUF934 domain-containing protein n=1 Tax=Acetobacter estunensis TaxID=104097 RepID=A0A967B4S1_9PROT|nr:DUF934 domain-containing protein [Acetobacter estunensis]NHO53750.1 DUF934 domain-containing protein [Acetobacter estunensis]GBQ20166.1 hypothetical protein AA0472_0058 [Acetobacter estunensis NRIC 0472]
MPLLENGRPVQNTWRYVAEGEALDTGDIIVPLERLTEGLAHMGGRVGVLLPADAQVSALKEALPKLALVAVTFPIFRDGRAFSQARALREHLHFTGDIRATGHVLPDQYEMLIRCGVSTVEVPDGTDLSVWAHALDQFDVAMQPSPVLDEKPTGFAFRRLLDRVTEKAG